MRLVVVEFLINGHCVRSTKAVRVEVTPVEISRVVFICFFKDRLNILWDAVYYFHESFEYMENALKYVFDKTHVIPHKAEVVQSRQGWKWVHALHKRVTASPLCIRELMYFAGVPALAFLLLVGLINKESLNSSM